MNSLKTDTAAPDFRHVDTWIFDLDNTLYRADSDLFAQIEDRMNGYITDKLAFSAPDAAAMRARYYRDYGSTLSGLVEHHGVDADDFLAFVHDIDLSAITPDSRVTEGIARLPGKRLVFTNGCRYHAARVLDRTGLSHLMHDVIDIRSVDLKPKPKPEAYAKVVDYIGFSPRAAAMFEDMAVNLIPAHALGMTTVWIANGSVWSDQGPEMPAHAGRHIDHTIDDLGAFLATIRLA